RGFVRVVDGDTLDVNILDANGESQRVAVGLVGVQAPMGNTDCGREAIRDLKALVKGGGRFEEDSTIAVDGRKRRMFRAGTLNGRNIADDLVRNGHGRWDGRGEHGAQVNAAETEAHSAARGCVWQSGEATPDLRGPRLVETDQHVQRTLPGRNSETGAVDVV